MTDSVVVQIPNITAAAITPNPVSMNVKFLLAVSVTEVSVTLEPEIRYSGELYSGEV